jgi:TolA-binding protein
VITDAGSKLTVTPVAITQFAAKHGAKPTKTRGPKTAESVQSEEKARHDTTKKQLSEADKKIATLETELLETELQAVKDRIEANTKDAANKQKVREKLRSDLRACQAELKS